MKRLENRVAIVTGAGSSGPGWGNGKATAVTFAREGAKVLAVDINLKAAEETSEIIRGEGEPRRDQQQDRPPHLDVFPHRGIILACAGGARQARGRRQWRDGSRAGWRS